MANLLKMSESEIVKVISSSHSAKSKNTIEATYRIFQAESRRKVTSEICSRVEAKHEDFDCAESITLTATSPSSSSYGWRIGLEVHASFDDLDDGDVMIYILTMMKQLKGVDWRHCSHRKEEFKMELHIHHPNLSKSRPNLKEPDHHPALVIGFMQLYRNYRDHSFVVDFHHISGDKFLFMSTVAAIHLMLQKDINIEDVSDLQ
jgi:hypothetical protein